MTEKAPKESNLSDPLRLWYQALLKANVTDERAPEILGKNDIEKDYLTRAGT